jgi:hypothetical protein
MMDRDDRDARELKRGERKEKNGQVGVLVLVPGYLRFYFCLRERATLPG